jgi:hypothetical protein
MINNFVSRQIISKNRAINLIPRFHYNSDYSNYNISSPKNVFYLLF